MVSRPRRGRREAHRFASAAAWYGWGPSRGARSQDGAGEAGALASARVQELSMLRLQRPHGPVSARDGTVTMAAGRLAAGALFAVCSASGGRARRPRACPTWAEAWPRVRWWEAVDALALTFGDTLYEDRASLPTRASWTGPILFDSWARSVFRADNAPMQSFASTTTDILYMGGALVPFVMDDYLGALSIHQNAGEVAWQLTPSSTSRRTASPAS